MNISCSYPSPLLWESADELNPNNFQALLDNKIAGIKVDNLLSAEECFRLIPVLRDFGLRLYEYEFEAEGLPPAAHLFEPHYLYELKSPEEYWPHALQSYALYDQLVQCAEVDPVRRLMEILRRAASRTVEIAQQDGHKYFFTIVRELNHSVLLHTDYAPAIPPYWSISQITSELAWNIYLTDPGEGGECRVYNCPWMPEHDRFLVGDSYAYDPVVVKDSSLMTFKPAVGQLVIFNSRNLHEVAAASQSRLSIGGHFGACLDGSVICWA
jgi:hypothetical protein